MKIQNVSTDILFQVNLDRLHIFDVDNDTLKHEVLKQQKKICEDPTQSAYEDTYFNPKPNSVGEQLIQSLNSVFESNGLTIHGLWSHIHYPRESTNTHDHKGPNIISSFVYYVDVPKDSGSLCFCFEDVSLVPVFPKQGDLYIFPSWVKHYVTRNLGNDIRISISGNLVKYQK